METENLPCDELKKFGIINEDLSFTKKLTENDIQKFLKGYTIVVDNHNNRATFQLTDKNSKLKVIFLERDRGISEILKNSKREIQYSEIRDVSKEQNGLHLEKKAFIYDKDRNIVAEYDLIKNAAELTAVLKGQKEVTQVNRYRDELKKLKNYLLDKVDQFPEIAKELSNALNIVSREINTVSSLPTDETERYIEGRSTVDLNVNDPDLFDDANSVKNDGDTEQELEKRGRYRR